MRTFTLAIFFTFVLLSFTAQAQYIRDSVNSGPSFKAFQQSFIWAGAGWNTVNYNDSAWTYSWNGAGTNGGSGCLPANTSIWGGADTCIWTRQTSIPPDSGCFRKLVNLPKCGTVSYAEFSVNADDYATTFINGNLLGAQPTSNIGVHYVLDSAQLAWFTPGNNVFAFEVINSSPNCGQFGVTGAIYIDTIGCSTSGINDLHRNQFTVSPNPTKGIVNISASVSGIAYTVKVFDIIGNLISQYESPVSIDISDQPKGVYIIQLSYANGAVTNKKIVKE